MSRPPLTAKEMARINGELLDAVEAAKLAYIQAKGRAARLNDIGRDCGPNHADGVAAHKEAVQGERLALQRYTGAIKALTNFVVHDKTPPPER